MNLNQQFEFVRQSPTVSLSDRINALKASGRELTRERVLEQLSMMNEFTSSVGIPMKFSADQHLGARTIIVMRCISATEAENISGLMEGDADIAALDAMLKAD